MKAVILAGGLVRRLIEETTLKTKPMVEIGGKPISPWCKSGMGVSLRLS